MESIFWKEVCPAGVEGYVCVFAMDASIHAVSGESEGREQREDLCTRRSSGGNGVWNGYVREACGALDAGEEGRDEDSIEGVMG